MTNEYKDSSDFFQPEQPTSEEFQQKNPEHESTHVEVVESFDEMNLKDKLLRGIYAYGYEKPSAVQSRAILPCLTGNDVIVQAQSGTGKTATFSISVLQNIDAEWGKTQALVLSPTRELAQQSASVMMALGEHTGAKVHVSVGGTRRRDEMVVLERENPHVIVGTPGRVLDLMDKGAIKTGNVRMFVIDEADEMLDSGFQDQFRDILKLLPEEAQIVLLSATMPQSCLDMTTKFMRDPIKVLIKKEEVTLEGISQYYVSCNSNQNVPVYEQKVDALQDLYSELSVAQSVVFVNKKRTAEQLTSDLNRDGHTVSMLHGEMETEERKRVMKEFRSGSSRVLVTTDILARGIDVQQVSLVFNFDLPMRKEQYIHRIGRSGRFGRKGAAINFIGSTEDEEQMRLIQDHYHTRVGELPGDLASII